MTDPPTMRTLMTLLCDTNETDWDDAEAIFLGGDCGTFAYALWQRTGWKAMCSGNHVKGLSFLFYRDNYTTIIWWLVWWLIIWRRHGSFCNSNVSQQLSQCI